MEVPIHSSLCKEISTILRSVTSIKTFSSGWFRERSLRRLLVLRKGKRWAAAWRVSVKAAVLRHLGHDSFATIQPWEGVQHYDKEKLSIRLASKDSKLVARGRFTIAKL